MKRFGTRQRELYKAWVVSDRDLTDIVCEDCARKYAREKGVDISAGFSSGEEEFDIYPLESWNSGEADTPTSCSFTWDDHGFLDVGLTFDGMQYLIENYGPSVHRLYGYKSESEIKSVIKRFTTRKAVA